MKKYFAFDNEKINGWSYLKRIIVSALLSLLLVGLWLAASTGYKRAGAFGWKNDLRIVVAILIPIHVLINILPDEVFDNATSPTFWMIVFLLSILHLILLVKNGNKKTQNKTSQKKINKSESPKIEPKIESPKIEQKAKPSKTQTKVQDSNSTISKFCSQCGSKQEGNKFCTSCGSNIE